MSTMSDEITIVIPTIPERAELFEQALASVTAQTKPCKYLIGEDTEGNGPAATVNALAECVQTEWLCRLDDDDLLDPEHVDVLSKWLDGYADIVYTWCRIEGGGELHPENQFQVRWQAMPGGWANLEERNWIPCTAAIRMDVWHELGGYSLDEREEDWDFWKRAQQYGAPFRCVPTVTWTYRMNAQWNHRSALHELIGAQ